ncbi:MAG: hypothetical protein R6V40_01460 [Candidatus Moraniibacteriota bacterium]
MVEQGRTNAGQGLGIAGLVLGIISIPLAIMGCTMFVALLFGGVGIVLSAIGMSQAKQSNQAKGLPTSGLVVSIIGTSIALLWFLFIGSFFQDVFDDNKWLNKIEKLEHVGEEMEKEVEGNVEKNEEKMKELESKMEELEGELKGKSESSDEAVNKTKDSLKRVEEELDNLRKEKKD